MKINGSLFVLRLVLGLASFALLVNCVRGADTDRLRYDGLTEPYRQIALAAGEPGIIDTIDVKEGQAVDAHQVLAKLDTEVLERTLDIAKQRSQSVGALQAAEAERELRQTYLDQLRPLHDRGHATQRELDRAAADLRVAEARVAMAKEELELQVLECRRIEAQIERRTIRSPLKGVVSEVLREQGESFLSSDARVVTVVQLDKLRAKFPVDPRTAGGLSAGQSVDVELADGATGIKAEIETVSPVIDAKSDTVLVTVTIDNAQLSLPSGARCVLLLTGTSTPSGTATQFTSKRRAPEAQPAQ